MDNVVYLLGIKKYYDDYLVVTVLWNNCYLGRIINYKDTIKVKCGRHKEFETNDMSSAVKVFAKYIKRKLDYNSPRVFYREIEVDMFDEDFFTEVN